MYNIELTSLLEYKTTHRVCYKDDWNLAQPLLGFLIILHAKE